jgi:hypothetical protein
MPHLIGFFSFLFLFLFPSPTRAVEDTFLSSGVFTLPTTGAEFRTPQPLAPYKTYRIQISSPYDLSPLQRVRFKKIAGIWLQFTEEYDRESSGILFDGEPAESFERGEETRDSLGTHISKLVFFVQGKGEALRLRTAADYPSVIKNARVDIVLNQEEPAPASSFRLLVAFFALVTGAFLLRKILTPLQKERAASSRKEAHGTASGADRVANMTTFHNGNRSLTGENRMRKQAHPSAGDDFSHDDQKSKNDLMHVIYFL